MAFFILYRIFWLLPGDVVSWMHRFSVLVAKITLSKFAFVDGIYHMEKIGANKFLYGITVKIDHFRGDPYVSRMIMTVIF